MRFTSTAYFSSHPFDIDNPYFYSVNLQVVNDVFTIADIEGSEKIFEHYSEPSYDYDGTWPRETTTVSYSCDSLPSSESIGNLPTVNYLVRFYPIDEKLFWGVNAYNRVIRLPKFETLSYEGNGGSIGGGSLIGLHVINDRHCHSMPLDTQFYIPFKKQICYKYNRKSFGE